MRIRSIKPEFWRSTDISELPIEDRLLFIGMWSYVDDNGVGIDKLSAITADLFADDLEKDPQGTFARVSRGLANLSASGRILRYTLDKVDYLSITNWAKHQRIDRPGKPRLPQYDAELGTIREGVASLPVNVSPGAVDQGTGEQRIREQGADARRGTGVTGTRIPKNFTATPEMIAWALEHCPNVNRQASTMKFKAHYNSAAGNAQFKTDWESAWQAWLLGDQEKAEQRPTQFLTSKERQLQNGARLHAKYTALENQKQKLEIEATP